MKELAVRTLAGAVYVVVTLGSILAGKWFFALFFELVLIISLYEYYRLIRREGHNPRVIMGILTAAYLYASVFLYMTSVIGPQLFLGLIPLLMLIPAVELFSDKQKKIQNISYTTFGIVYIGIPLSLATLIVVPAPGMEYNPLMLIG
ncbi:MAG TPA: phosphatidate cytidylyltransferase, partial [Prolixibacteraceae bacterium]|nr:phosphatidate cytidylyltransferase [Prolixibacteraceae bacterium]